ncbi:hypothetical protein V1264_021312 [Littorina saxatilis]|uniref:Uncharacterized protein n=1 Tax=Littorina saxatilis TaxID=31220 RepID=A0AAN9AI05_9CAEN
MRLISWWRVTYLVKGQTDKSESDRQAIYKELEKIYPLTKQNNAFHAILAIKPRLESCKQAIFWVQCKFRKVLFGGRQCIILASVGKIDSLYCFKRTLNII